MLNLRSSCPQTLIEVAASQTTLEGINLVFDSDNSLALFTLAKLSTYQYQVVRKSCLNIGHNIFPNYKKVQQSKKKLYAVTEIPATA